MSKSLKRQKKILKLIEANNYMSLEQLARYFEISMQTARRDVHTLTQKNLVVKYHGGAARKDRSTNVAYEVRQINNAKAKAIIAQKAAKMVPDGATICLTIGTTLEKVASELNNKKNLLIFTNSIFVAQKFIDHTHKVMLPEGCLNVKNGGITGQATIEFFKKIQADFVFFSAGAIDQQWHMYDFDYDETLITTQLLCGARKKTILCADTSKLDRTTTFLIGEKEEHIQWINER